MRSGDFTLYELDNGLCHQFYCENRNDHNSALYFKGFALPVFLPTQSGVHWINPKYDMDRLERITNSLSYILTNNHNLFMNNRLTIPPPKATLAGFTAFDPALISSTPTNTSLDLGQFKWKMEWDSVPSPQEKKCDCGANKTYGPDNKHHSSWCTINEEKS